MAAKKRSKSSATSSRSESSRGRKTHPDQQAPQGADPSPKEDDRVAVVLFRSARELLGLQHLGETMQIRSAASEGTSVILTVPLNPREEQGIGEPS